MGEEQDLGKYLLSHTSNFLVWALWPKWNWKRQIRIKRGLLLVRRANWAWRCNFTQKPRYFITWDIFTLPSVCKASFPGVSCSKPLVTWKVNNTFNPLLWKSFTSGFRGDLGARSPLAVKMLSKSYSFKGNPLFWTNVGLGTLSWGQNSTGPPWPKSWLHPCVTKIPEKLTTLSTPLLLKSSVHPAAFSLQHYI